MRTIKLVAITLIMSVFSTVVFANNAPNIAKKDSKVYQQVRTEVTSFIQNPELKEHGITDEDVKVRFKVNNENEIELLNIKAESDYLKSFVQKKMENQNVQVEGIKSNEIYEITFAFILR
ncbi:MAG: hypothetical protein NXI23_04990 [Bacteroidetes bacterium]|jgi:ribosomal protein L31E|nr:hypothetical protein [Bacteroidota bacterium]MDF1863241.1 hypothetical protein [Saprospiraceae bacterium]